MLRFSFVLVLFPLLAATVQADDLASSTDTTSTNTDTVLDDVVDISATCQDLYWISFSVMSTWNNMYSNCIINPEISDVCKWMKNVVSSTTGWINDNGCQSSETYGSFAMTMNQVNLPSAQSLAYSFTPPETGSTTTSLFASSPVSSSVAASIVGFLSALVVVGGTAYTLRHKIIAPSHAG